MGDLSCVQTKWPVAVRLWSWEVIITLYTRWIDSRSDVLIARKLNKEKHPPPTQKKKTISFQCCSVGRPRRPDIGRVTRLLMPLKKSCRVRSFLFFFLRKRSLVFSFFFDLCVCGSSRHGRQNSDGKKKKMSL